MKILVTGSREWSNAALVERAIAFVARPTRPEDITIIHGAARGADSCADIASQRLGITRVDRYPAEWNRLGRTAGFERNVLMLESQPDLVLAFKSNLDQSLQRGGTEHMVRIALAAGTPVKWCDGLSLRTITAAAAEMDGVL